MLAAFESILPIFLLILLGNLLRRTALIEQAGWRGLEQLGYWFLYPALLFVTIFNADLGTLAIDAMMAALLSSVAFMCALTLALWPLFSRFGLISAGEFSSVFQTTIRWNGFIALALAQSIFPPQGMAVVALAMAVIIIPINIVSVYVVTRFADREMDWRRLLWTMATNPLILPCLAAIAMRAMPFGLYAPVNQMLELAGQAALGIALLAIGASLRIRDLLKRRFPLLLPVVLKLLLFPVVLIAIALAVGVRGDDLVFLTLIAAVPTATNGYLLARQLGGDAELYAAVTTLQTMISFFSIPAMLALAAQFGGG